MFFRPRSLLAIATVFTLLACVQASALNDHQNSSLIERSLVTSDQTSVAREEIEAFVRDPEIWSIVTALQACPLIFSEPVSAHIFAGGDERLVGSSLAVWLEAYALFLERSYERSIVREHVDAVRLNYSLAQSSDASTQGRVGHFDNWARRMVFAAGLVEAQIIAPSDRTAALSQCSANESVRQPPAWTKAQFDALAGNPRYLAYNLWLVRSLREDSLALPDWEPSPHLKTRIFTWMWGREPNYFQSFNADDAVAFLPSEIDLEALRRGDLLQLPFFVITAADLGFLDVPPLTPSDRAGLDEIIESLRMRAVPGVQ